MYCKGHEKEHEDKSWKFIEGNWYCTKYHRPSRLSEFMPANVTDDRQEYFNSIVQPYRDGKLSKEYLDAHGTKGIEASDKEIREAKPLWRDLKGYNTRKKSK